MKLMKIKLLDYQRIIVKGRFLMNQVNLNCFINYFRVELICKEIAISSRNK